MASQDKVLLVHKVEDTLKPRMFANLLEEAVDEIQNHLDDFDVNYIAKDGVIETEDLLKTFLEAKRVRGLSENTLTRYQYIIERFMKFAKVKTREVTKYHIREYFSSEQNRRINESTIEGYRQILNGYFTWLEKEKLIANNPVYNIEPIKAEKKELKAFSNAEIERMKRVCNIRSNAIISLLLSTGCRVSEVYHMNIQDINFDQGECTVLGKGRKQRTVYLDEVAIISLKEYIASRIDNCEALFVNRYGERLQPNGIREDLKRVEELSGVNNVHPHRFRRTMITKFLNRGMPIQEVAILAGHDKVDTTMRYFHASKNRIKNSYLLYSS